VPSLDVKWSPRGDVKVLRAAIARSWIYSKHVVVNFGSDGTGNYVHIDVISARKGV
jgi:hypothetical protein